MKKHEVKIVHRGWRAHFCLGHRCRYSRNTLVGTYPDAIIVSTVGNMYSDSYGETPETIGRDRYYETMMFEPMIDGKYIDADVANEISFDGKCAIDHVNDNADNEADSMHNAAIEKAIEMLMVQP